MRRPSRVSDRRTLLRRAGALLCAGALLLGGAAAAQDRGTVPPPDRRSLEGLRLIGEGADAPRFVLRDPGGAAVSYGGGQGAEPLLIVFASVFCDPCRRVLPAVQGLHEKYGDGMLDVVAVMLDGEPLADVVAGFMRQEGYTFPAALDEPGAQAFHVAGLYKVAEIPAVVLVDRRGKVALAETGLVPGGDLEKAVRSVLDR
jgi:peroxiredoxin